MILECSECHVRYLVSDKAIGENGRTVRCAACRHSWFQKGVALPPEPSVEDAATPVAADPFQAFGRGAPIAPPFFATPVESPVPAVEAFPDSIDQVVAPRRLRRNPARRWTVAAVAAAVLMLVAIGIILWTSAPGIAQQLGLPLGPAESPLRLVDNPIERRDLANGSELFAVSGKVLNPSLTRQRVPDIRADLRDARGRIVYSWTITPQARTLGPKSAIDFNSAKLDVPATSRRLELSFQGEEG